MFFIKNNKVTYITTLFTEFNIIKIMYCVESLKIDNNT